MLLLFFTDFPRLYISQGRSPVLLLKDMIKLWIVRNKVLDTVERKYVMARKVSIGYQEFDDMIRGNLFYIDKTGLYKRMVGQKR